MLHGWLVNAGGWGDRHARRLPGRPLARLRRGHAPEAHGRPSIPSPPSPRTVEAFRFKDLLGPLKRDARGRWVTLLAEEEDGGDGVSGQSFEEVARRVSASIERLEADSRTRSQLRTLWHHLWRQHGEEDREAGRPASYRQLGQRLDIPRERLPGLFDLLRQIVTW